MNATPIARPELAARLRLASPRTALALGGFATVTVLVGGVLTGLTHDLRASFDGMLLVVIAVVGGVGFVVARRNPSNSIGWLLLCASGLIALYAVGVLYTVLDYRLHSGSLPLGRVALASEPSWVLGFMLLGLAVALFPDGHITSARWRRTLYLYIAASVWFCAIWSLSQATLHIGPHFDVDAVGNYVGSQNGFAGVTANVAWSAAPLVLVLLMAFVLAQAATWRRAKGERRKQAFAAKGTFLPLESYLEEHEPGWDVLRGARGVFKEPHRADSDSGLPMSTMDVRNCLRGAPDLRIAPVPVHFPTRRAENRFGAVLICEKEGFDALLQAEGIPERYDLALMSTKGISARAARDLAESLGVPCFTLHDMDKNGFVMAAGFPFATDIGIRLPDIAHWGLTPEEQLQTNPSATRQNLLANGATFEEADFIIKGRRVELNMFTGPQFIQFVEQNLQANSVTKIIPDADTLQAAWKRAHLTRRVNQLIEDAQDDDDEAPQAPDGRAEQICERLDADPSQSWDEALRSTLDESDEEA